VHVFGFTNDEGHLSGFPVFFGTTDPLGPGRVLLQPEFLQSKGMITDQLGFYDK